MSPSQITLLAAAQLEDATASFAVFFQQMYAAIRARNLVSTAELGLDEAVLIANDLGLGEPITGIVVEVLPLIFAELNIIGSQPLILVNDRGWQSYVTPGWANDPRHWLNNQGQFIE